MKEDCKHDGERTLVVLDAFAEHETTAEKCSMCNKILIEKKGRVAVELLKKSLMKSLKK